MSEKVEERTVEESREKAQEANDNLNAERLKRLEAIADGSEEKRREDFDDLEVKEEEPASADEIEAKALQEEGVETADSDTKQVNGETYYRQIVNGHEKWQTLKQIRDAAQKVESADDYLRQASESVRNAARLALSDKDEPSKVEEVDLRSLLRAAVLGEEDAIDKLATALQARPSEVTPDVVQAIDQRLSFRTELAQLQEKSRDLLENKYLGRLFHDRLNDLKSENPTMSLKEAYTSIDQELRSAFPGMVKTSTQDKLERKKRLVNPPTAAARQVVESEDDEEDISEAIAKIAKARGLTAHLHRTN